MLKKLILKLLFIESLKKNVLNEMNKTVLLDETGSFVGLINNERIVENMSFFQIVKHNLRIRNHYKHA